MDIYARGILTEDDFTPELMLDARIPLDQVTPKLFKALDLLEPFGQGNPEPVFAAMDVRIAAPPRILKDKHVKFKLGVSQTAVTGHEGNQQWRKSITFDALAWRMAERVEKEKLLAGDALEVAFTVGHNDHPEFGGLELTVCDFKVSGRQAPATKEIEPQSAAAN